ncbi:TonB-dependent receptor plug domain-containing protein [Colwellia sp. MEBiC06753]
MFYKVFFTTLCCFSAVSVYGYDDVEIIEVNGARSQLLNNQLVSKNINSVSLVDSPTVKATMADWMSLTPSVSLNGQGGLLQSYSLRGFSRSRIRTEVDGVPIITDRRAGNSAAFINPFLIERIDVQQGPSATLYGSDAMGGVVNILSTDMATKQLSLSGQSNDQAKNATLLWGDQQWQTAIGYRHANQAQAGNGQQLDSGYRQTSGLLKFSQQIGDYYLNASWLPSVGKDIGKSSVQYPDDRIVSYPTDAHSISQFSITQAQDWFFKLYHHYQNWDTDTLRVGKRRNFTEYQGHTIGVLSLWSLSLGDSISGGGSQGRIGIDWLSRRGVKIDETEYALSGDKNFTKHMVDGEQDNLAIFTDWSWQVSTTKLSSAIRYDYIKQSQSIKQRQRHDSQFNFSVLAEYPMITSDNHQQTVSAEWATGFRFPTLSELYFEGETPRGTTLGNPLLKPEQSQGVQLRWQLTTKGEQHWQIAAEAYYYQLDNYIERYNIDDDIRSYRNLERADIYGGEVVAQWQSQNHLAMKWTFQWQQGQDQQDTPLADLIPAQLSWESMWQWRDVDISNRFIWQFEQSDIGAGENEREGKFAWNIAGQKQLTPDLSLSIYGNNLLDKLAYTSADEDAPLQQGRTLGVKLNYLF